MRICLDYTLDLILRSRQGRRLEGSAANSKLPLYGVNLLDAKDSQAPSREQMGSMAGGQAPLPRGEQEEGLGGGTPSQKAVSRSSPCAAMLVENSRLIPILGTLCFALRSNGPFQKTDSRRAAAGVGQDKQRCIRARLRAGRRPAAVCHNRKFLLRSPVRNSLYLIGYKLCLCTGGGPCGFG